MYSSRLITFLFLLLPLQTIAEVYDVSTTAELRAALASAAANEENDTIRLAAGIYKTTEDGGGRFEYYSDKADDLTIIGSSSSSEEVILSGDNTHQVLNHRTTESASLYLQGLTVRDSYSPPTEYDTAAVNADGYINIFDCLFADNKTAGGAVKTNANADIDQSIFTGNLRYGADIDSYGLTTTVSNSSFIATNDNGNGVGFYTRGKLIVTNTVFRDNDIGLRHSGYGGSAGLSVAQSLFESNKHRGLSFYSQSDLQITDSKFRLNGTMNSEIEPSCPTRSNGSGAGAYIRANGRKIVATVERSIFEQNQGSFGGGIYLGINIESARISNSIFRDNTAIGAENCSIDVTGQAGSAIWDRNATPIFIYNTIFIEEENSLFLSGENNELVNNIFTESRRSAITGENGYKPLVTLKYNYIDPNMVDADAIFERNLFDFIDIEFVDTSLGNYRLSASSDLIDAGLIASSSDYGETDLDGNPRIIGASIDIGPYEYDGEAPPDSDGDGINDNIDNCPSIANEDQADFDSDGEGDVCDSDDDNDGTNDEDDAFPFDDTESLDTDGDGIGNNEDYDDDADGILDSFDNAPLVLNTIVVDSDSDGVIDSADAYPNDPTKQYSGSADLDGDGFTNDEEVDYCSNPFDKNSQPELGGLSLPLIQVITKQ